MTMRGAQSRGVLASIGDSGRIAPASPGILDSFVLLSFVHGGAGVRGLTAMIEVNFWQGAHANQLEEEQAS
jgi:hypothetical protein